MTRPHNPCVQPVQPLSLRDHFAGMALAGSATDGDSCSFEVHAQYAYGLADAMLAERAKGEALVEAAAAPSAGVVWRPISEWDDLQNDVAVLLWDNHDREVTFLPSVSYLPVWATHFAIIAPPEPETAQQDQPASVQPERNAEHERLREALVEIVRFGSGYASRVAYDALYGKEGSAHE